jgi:hypothetical protein
VRKDNKTFVKSMIITSVIGFSVLMIMMFVGIKYYVDKSGTSNSVQAASLADKQETKVEYSTTVLALVKQITQEKLVAFDIETKQMMYKSITVSTKVSDGYGGVIPLASIKEGDIVEVVFQTDKEKILSINKTSRSWIKPDLTGIKINTADNQVIIGKKPYKYTKDTLIFKENNRQISPTFLGEYDLLELQGVGDDIWSIKILKSASSLQILDFPTEEGMLEIDRTRMIPLKDLEEPIKLTAGKHKILITMKGYEPVTTEIELIPEENYVISLKDIKEAFTDLNVIVTNTVTDYTVQIADKTYAKGEKISLKQDKYTVLIKAEGYKDWEQELELDQTTYDLKVTLEQIIDETNVPDTGNEGNVDNGTETSNASYTINISTDPSAAYVYIGGVYKGQTPFKTTLPVGDYTVSLEKKGYETYNTTIIIDNSDNQNSFLYHLTPTE